MYASHTRRTPRVRIDVDTVDTSERCFRDRHMIQAYNLSCLVKISTAIKTAVRIDRNINTENLSFVAVEASKARGSKKEYQIVRQLMPGKVARPQMVQLETGSLATDPVQVRLRWQRFFAAKLVGKVVSSEDLIDGSVN